MTRKLPIYDKRFRNHMPTFEGVPPSGARSAAAQQAANEAFDDDNDEFETLPHAVEEEIERDPNPQSPTYAEVTEVKKRPVLSRPVKIRVNGVGITIPVIAHHVAARSICCILNEEGWDCELPITNDVEVTIGDTTYNAAYLGGFHHFVQMGIQTIYFPLPATDGELDNPPP